MTLNNPLLKFYSKKYCLPVYSGTLAIEGVLKTLDLPSNSKVLISSIACYSILEAVLNSGFKPIIAIPKNGILFTKLELENIIKKENIKIYIAVHQYGYYQELPKCKNLIIIEDFSQAWNIKSETQCVSKNSDYIITSLGSTKPLNNGIGGLILSDNYFIEKFDLKMKKDRYKDFCLIEYYYPLKINYKKIIKNANKKVRKQRKNANYYNEIFRKYSFINIFNINKITPSYHRYIISVEKEHLERIIKILDRCKIMYQKEYKLKLDEIPLTKSKKIKVIGENNNLIFLLLKTENSILNLTKLSKEMEKTYGT